MFTACFGKERQYGFLVKDWLPICLPFSLITGLTFMRRIEEPSGRPVRKNVDSLQENSFENSKEQTNKTDTHTAHH